MTNGHDLFECNLCSFESGHEDSVKEHISAHVNSALKKTEEAVKQSSEVIVEDYDDNIFSFESGYGDSLKDHPIQHVIPQNKTEKEKDHKITHPVYF